MTNNGHQEDPFYLCESDDRFPSGHWTGWYLQFGRKSRMRMSMTFQKGKVIATGRDPIGVFFFSGKYFADSGKVVIVKTYKNMPESAQVLYDGFCGGNGIRGFWQFTAYSESGEFHIWPCTESEGLEFVTQAETEVPIGDKIPGFVPI